jgi:hypothetical protein
MHFLAPAAMIVFAWPVYATWHAVALARTYDCFRAQAVTFAALLPALIVTTAIWVLLWTLAIWLLMRYA